MVDKLLDDIEAARRLATAILDEITFDNDERVRRAVDLERDLAPEIEQGRALFRARVSPGLAKVFEDEILAWRGRAKDRAAELAPTKVDTSRLLWLAALVVALAAVVAWLVLQR